MVFDLLCNRTDPNHAQGDGHFGTYRKFSPRTRSGRAYETKKVQLGQKSRWRNFYVHIALVAISPRDLSLSLSLHSHTRPERPKTKGQIASNSDRRLTKHRPSMEVENSVPQFPPKDRRPDALGDLTVIPDEIICAILVSLTPRDVARLSCVSRFHFLRLILSYICVRTRIYL